MPRRALRHEPSKYDPGKGGGRKALSTYGTRLFAGGGRKAGDGMEPPRRRDTRGRVGEIKLKIRIKTGKGRSHR